MKQVKRGIRVQTTTIKTEETVNVEGALFPMFSWTVVVDSKLFAIEKVTIDLHPTFENPHRGMGGCVTHHPCIELTTPPFQLNERGYGDFIMNISVQFKDASVEPISFPHTLNLAKSKYENTHNVVCRTKVLLIAFAES